jgi:type III pantothenate kinase
VDAGNTNLGLGGYEEDQLVGSLRLSTARERTADEMAALLLPLFAHHGLDARATDRVLISSVVPTINPALEQLAVSYFQAEARFVTADLDTGLTLRYDRPAEIGADRIANAVAARARYGAPVVVVDFGTATTFDVVDADGCYIGGVIAPGVMISAEALFSRASRLYRVDIRRPESIIGGDTGSAMQSGIYFGYVGQVDGILRRLHTALPNLCAVVATGGLASLIAEGSEFITEVNPQLTLHGLKLIDERLSA